MRRKTVLLTGSEGLIATTIIKPALSDTYHLIGFDLKLGDDLGDQDSIAEKIKGIDYVIHTAAIRGPLGAPSPEAYDAVNFQGTCRLLRLAKEAGVRKFIFFSSLARYGVDSWMRNREETGPITGEDVAVPRYLPIDEDHPSILEYKNLFEWGGKWYGESKARAEREGEALADERFTFISLRLTGAGEKTSKWVRRLLQLRDDARRGEPRSRKLFVYGAGGVATAGLLRNTLRASLQAELEGAQAFNVTEAETGLTDVVRLYFPETPVADCLFGTQKLLVFLNKSGFAYEPTTLPPLPQPRRWPMLAARLRGVLGQST
ncbi:MAG: NAD(P)-dependent oxidoreductase [Candidatus Tectomicrobia bacterium]|nr:NAD(P)-dependent oxidoreductase [Candidatus Tectomicrobia bacterium]